MPLILASTSPIRRAMLARRGRCTRCCRRDVDEDAVKQAHAGDGAELALRAGRGQGAVASSARGDWVIGSDSVLAVDGQRCFASRATAPRPRAHLAHFSGRTMHLSSAVALAREGPIEWNHVDEASSHVRPLSPEFIDDYLDAEWPEVGYCVGVFRMEGRGVTLFDAGRGEPFHHPRHAVAAPCSARCASGD